MQIDRQLLKQVQEKLAADFDTAAEEEREERLEEQAEDTSLPKASAPRVNPQTGEARTQRDIEKKRQAVIERQRKAQQAAEERKQDTFEQAKKRRSALADLM